MRCDHVRCVRHASCNAKHRPPPPLLTPGGSLAMKVLEGEEFPELLREVRALFARVKGFKPDSSRDVSREMFIVAGGYRPPVPARPLGNAS